MVGNPLSMKCHYLTARAVSQAINFDKYEVYPIFITKVGEWIKGGPINGPGRYSGITKN